MVSTLDLLVVKSIDENTKEPIIDFLPTSDGQLQSVYATEAVKQRAIIASFNQKGSIPQLPDVGIEWVELLTGQRTPAEINSQIFNAMHEYASTYDYVPKYENKDEQLIVTIEENK